MLYKTLKVAAGKINFQPNQEIELNDAEAAELLADGAIAPISLPVEPALPVEESPAPTTTKKRSK